MSEKNDTYHHGNLRQAMLLAAAQILAEKGLQGLTLRACARQAGVSHAAPAHHFAGLPGLLTAIAAQSFQMIADKVEGVFAHSTADPVALFAEFAKIYAEFASTNPERFRLMFRTDLLDTDNDELKQAERRAYTAFTKIVHTVRHEPAESFQLFSDGKLSKEIYKDTVLLWSTVHGFAHLNMEGQLSGYDGIIGTQDFEREVWEDLSTRLVTLVAKMAG